MDGIINVNDIRIFAYHGCLPEENLIGGHYRVDLKIFADYSESFKSDSLSDTVDYCQAFGIVKREMAIHSKLIEHVAARIALALKKEISRIEKVEVTVTKIAPPVNGPVGSVSVTVVK